MNIAILSPSTTSMENLRAILERGNPGRRIACHEGGISQLRAVAERDHPDVIIVEGLCRDTRELVPIEAVTAQFPRLFIIMLCTQQSSDVLLQAMRVGIREVLPSPVTAEALEAAVSRAESRTVQRAARRKAKVLAFVSCKGGSGATSLCSNLGSQLAKKGSKVLLIDLNLQYGEAVLTVNDKKPGSDIVQVARNLSRLDSTFLNASVAQVAPHFAVLAAPEDPAQSLEVKPEHLDAILAVAGGQYDFVLLDVCKNLDELTIRALDRADKVFVVTQLTLPAVRNASRMLNVFRSLSYPAGKVEVLVNRYWKNAEIGIDELRAALGKVELRTVPNAYRDVTRSINLGVPLEDVSQTSPVVRAIAELADSLQPASQGGEPHSGFLGRLFGH
ncbi:MAG TPA: AAA family ATPase [Burkholderiaceae bacterium]